jgi:hypothetical protein
VATWQFDFHLVPRTNIERRFDGVPVTLSKEDYDQTNWWNGTDLLHEFEVSLSALLPKGHSWDPQQATWGAEDGDRFDVLREGHQIAEVYGRLDVRNLSLAFLNRVVELARRHELLVVTEGRHLLRPSVKEFLRAISRSPSFAYISDPERFLRELGETD